MIKTTDGVALKLLNLAKAARQDGWFNTLTGLGISGKDKRLGAGFRWQQFVESDSEHLYAVDDTAARVVDLIPQEGFREGYDIKVPNEEGGVEITKKIMEEIERLQVNEKFEQAWAWSRLYGGSALFISADDGLKLDQPLIPNKIKQIKSLTVLNRHELNATKIDSNIESRNYGMPESYQLSPSSGNATTAEIHYSRIIRFEGARLPTRLFIQNNYWGDTVLNRLLNVLRNFNLVHDSAAYCIQDFRQGVLKLKGLADLIASNDDEIIKKRIELMNLSKSVLNSIILDADSEDFQNINNSLSGAGEIIKLVNNRLVAATGMPHTIVLGESPSGLGASGSSEKRDFYDTVSAQQENYLRPRLVKMIDLIIAQQFGPTKGVPIPNLTLDFRPLWQLSLKEQSDIRVQMATADEKYINTSVLDPSEVAISRFGGDGYSIETTIDAEARKAEPTPIEPISENAST